MNIKTYSGFRGINKHGNAAPEGSLEACHNLTPVNGRLEVVQAIGRGLYHAFDSTAGVMSGGLCLDRSMQKVGQHLLSKQYRMIFTGGTGENVHEPHPIWIRSTSYVNQPEKFTAFGDEIFVSPASPTLTSNNNGDKPISWGGHAALCEMAVVDGTGGTQWTVGALVDTAYAKVIKPGYHMWGGLYDEANARIVWYSQAHVVSYDSATNIVVTATAMGVTLDRCCFADVDLIGIIKPTVTPTATAPATTTGSTITGTMAAISRKYRFRYVSSITGAAGIWSDPVTITPIVGKYGVITSATNQAATAIVVTADNNLTDGQNVLIAGNSNAAINGVFTVNMACATTFQLHEVGTSTDVLGTGAPGATSTGGTFGANGIVRLAMHSFDGHDMYYVPYSVDGIEIYRSTYDGTTGYGPYYLVATVPTTKTTATKIEWNTDTAAWYDTGYLDGDIEPDDVYWHEVPDHLGHITNFNGRLWAVDYNLPGQLRASSIDRPHSWPTTIVDALDPTGSQIYAGLSWLTEGTDTIRAIIPEGGAITSDINRGDSLLIFKNNKVLRLTGTDATNFSLQTALSVGTVDGRSVQNCNGYIMFLGPEQIMRIGSGSNIALPVSTGILPNGLAYGATGISAFWSQYYYITLTNAGVTTTHQFDFLTDQWSTVATSIAFAQFSDYELLGYSAALGYFIYRFEPRTFVATVPMAPGLSQTDWYFTTSTSDFGLPLQGKRIVRVWLKVKHEVAANQTVTLDVYVDGCPTSAYSASKISTYSSTSNSAYKTLIFADFLNAYMEPIQGHDFQFKVSSSMVTTYGVFGIEGMFVEYEAGSLLTEII